MDLRLHDHAEIINAINENPSLCNECIPDDSLAPEQRITMLWQAAAFGDAELLRLFCEQSDANIDVQRMSDGVAALYVAAQNGHKECCRVLLERGANVNVQRHTLATPLFIAVQKGHSSIVQLLLDHEADQSIENDQLATPYVLACNLGLTEIALMLMRRGAEIGHKKTGLTGMGWCRREQKIETLRRIQMELLVPWTKFHDRVAQKIVFELWMSFPAKVRAEREAARLALVHEREALLSGGALPSVDELVDLGGEFTTGFVVPKISNSAVQQHADVLRPLLATNARAAPHHLNVDLVETRVNEVLYRLRTDTL